MDAGSPAPKGSELWHAEGLPRGASVPRAAGWRGRPCRGMGDAARARVCIGGAQHTHHSPATIIPPLAGGVSPCGGFGMQHKAAKGSDGVWGRWGRASLLQSTGAAVGGTNRGARCRGHGALPHPYIFKERPELVSQRQGSEAGRLPLQQTEHVAEHGQGHSAGITVSILQQLHDVWQQDQGSPCLWETRHLLFCKAATNRRGENALQDHWPPRWLLGRQRRLQTGLTGIAMRRAGCRVGGQSSFPAPRLSSSPPTPLGRLVGN